MFVLLSVKAAHLELVSNPTSEAFVATFRRFIARRGKPSFVWSDHGSNFVGAQTDLKDLVEFIEDHLTLNAISQFCTSQINLSQNVHRLWKLYVKSMKIQ